MRIVGHNDAHQRAVLGRNIFVVEGDVAVEAENAGIIFGPVFHFAKLHVADNVVYAQNAAIISGDRRGGESGQKRSFVIFVGDQRVDGVAIRVDGAAANGAVFIGDVMRLFGGFCASAHGFFKCIVGIVHFERDVTHAIAVPEDMVGGRVVGRKRRGENEVRLALAQRIRSSLALAGFQSAVGDL